MILTTSQIGGAAIELATSMSAFWPMSGQKYREANPRTRAGSESRLKEAFKSGVTWVSSVFLLGYVCAKVALGGWIVTFMRQERGGGDFESGMVATGFGLASPSDDLLSVSSLPDLERNLQSL